MNHPDQRYAAHTYYLDDLREQAGRHQALTAIAQHRPATTSALRTQIGAKLASLSAWVAKSAAAHLFRSPLS